MSVTADQTFLFHTSFQVADSFVHETNHPLSFKMSENKVKGKDVKENGAASWNLFYLKKHLYFLLVWVSLIPPRMPSPQYFKIKIRGLLFFIKIKKLNFVFFF